MRFLKKNYLKRKPYYLFLVTLTVMVACLGLGGLKLQPLQAREFPTQPVEVATNWQYASFPVENFQGYTSPFGYRISPYNGQREFHSGLDIAAPLGSYVRAWWAGQVVELSDNSACGTSVKIQSGQWTHIYCHLNGYVDETASGRYLIDREGGILLWQGQQIPAGARIARVGMTGRTTGPHLHWSLKYAGEYIDPAMVLRQMYQS